MVKEKHLSIKNFSYFEDSNVFSMSNLNRYAVYTIHNTEKRNKLTLYHMCNLPGYHSCPSSFFSFTSCLGLGKGFMGNVMLNDFI